MTSGVESKNGAKRNGASPKSRKPKPPKVPPVDQETKPAKAAKAASELVKVDDHVQTVVVVGLLQLAPRTSLTGMTFLKLSQELREITLPDKTTTIVDLWLDSPGGSARDAYKIALLLRSISSRIRVVIPNYAKSAATLLSLVADEIYMSPAAELGPLDAQLDYERNPGTTVSALDRIGNLNQITEAARDIVLGLGGEVQFKTRLGRGETIAVMADLASNLLQPLVSQVDPTILHQSSRILVEAVHYGKRLMQTRSDCSRELAMSLPERLTKDFPTHGYAISLDEAAELGLPVKPMAEYEYREQAIRYHMESQSSKTNVVEVINIIERSIPAKTEASLTPA